MPQDRPDNEAVAHMTKCLARGEERAWRWLHDHYFGILHAAAIARGTPPGDAADLVQRTYLRILRHAKRFRTEPDFCAWLCCLLRCEAIDAARSGRRRLALLEKFQHREELKTPSESPASLHIHEVLDDLAPPDRDLITRHYVQGWSQGELAAEHGLTPKAIESKLARLRRRLRHSLENQNAC